ncbi:HAMP domain-containing sensor histidine kinase [Streptomyces sp. N35]|uniref:sensor histidine kinase n=1 Tax=Streptomyces sp. N35 TaxID=2795730 RepID=UPI0018F76D18|nr:ATP-binding protein [Streptomyces sp. N35]
MRRRLLPPGSERLRLTALYTGLLLLAGGGLIALIYVLLWHGLYASINGVVTSGVADVTDVTDAPTAERTPALETEQGPKDPQYLNTIQFVDDIQHAALNRLLTVSLIALAVFAVVSVMLAWWMAGRVLRPVSVITETARRLSGENLHERIALDAPPGELKRLADTFDEMLERIERLVSAQQRFAANAAHELRTPLALQRAAAEIGLAGEPDAQRVERIRRKLIDISDDSERMIEGLLELAVSQQALERHEPVALQELAGAVTLDLSPVAAERGVTLDLDAQPLPVVGDPVLLAGLVHNLVSNAIRYNHRGGRVLLRTGADGLEVTNTGPTVPPDTVPHLFEPFRRLEARRHAPGEGAGLGLSIVAAIARAHGAVAHAESRAGGGLTVRVTFPLTG